jgi:hypothetical protein
VRPILELDLEQPCVDIGSPVVFLKRSSQNLREFTAITLGALNAANEMSHSSTWCELHVRLKSLLELSLKGLTMTAREALTG